MIAALRIETAPPAIDVAGQDLAPGSTTWTALPDLGETTVSAANSRRELDYMHARFHSPLTGRFLSVDPALTSRALKQPQAWNRYSYVIGNPLKYVDPAGELWFKIEDLWTYLDGVNERSVSSVDADGNDVVTVTAGRESVVGFNGDQVTYYGPGGSTTSWDAVSGDVDSAHRTQPGLQGVRDRGPIPEGMYSFNPALIQNYDRHVNALDKLAGLVAARGGWRGGRASWGNNRVELTPYPSTNTYGRSGFYIHGGKTPGSRGCIDLCSRADDFFSVVGTDPGSLDVDVDYP